MTLPNFDNQLSQRLPLCKELEELISGFFLIQPTTTFVANKWSHRYNGDRTLHESERPIGSVQVYQDSQHLGYVRVKWEEYRNFGHTNVYYIGSETIYKSRGRNRNEVTTKDPHKAIKIMQEYFKPKPNYAFRDKMVNDCTNQVKSMLSNAKYRVGSLLEKASTDVPLYLLEQHEGLSPALPGVISSILESPENLQHFHNLRIAYSVSKEHEKGGAIVVAFSNSTLWYLDLTDHITSSNVPMVKIKSTYDLPTNYQEKFSLLKLCDSSQPVEHVGVRFRCDIEKDSEAMLYYLVSGDTVVTC